MNNKIPKEGRMIDLKTCNRSEFVESYQNLEDENKFLKSEVHHLNKRLQEYEGIQTDDDKVKEFQKFWEMFGCKGNKKTAQSKWMKLSKKKRTKIFKVVLAYVKSTPDKQYRKGGESWLHNECWNDEIEGGSNVKEFHRPPTGAKAMYKEPTASKPVTIDISERIKSLKKG